MKKVVGGYEPSQIQWSEEYIADIIKYYNDGYFDLEINGVYGYEPVAHPWDMDISLYGNKVILTGSMTASGIGYCKCELTVSEFLDMFSKI